jgi:hypothetical protein
MYEYIGTADWLTHTLTSRAGSRSLDPTPARHFREALGRRYSNPPITCPLAPPIRHEDYPSSRLDLDIVQSDRPVRLFRQLFIFDQLIPLDSLLA